MEKKVFVTGSTGLVGSNLCKKLIEKGYKVKALVRKSSDRSFLNTLNNLEYVEGDITDLDSLNNALNDVDYVVHCAAQVSITSKFDKAHAETNILGTRNLLQSSVENKIKKFVHISTVGVLGITKDHYNTKEDVAYLKTGIPYTDTKIDAERLVLNYYEDKNLPTTVIRPGFIFGKNDRNGLPYIMPYALKKQITWISSGNNEIALTNVNNLCNAIISAMEKDISNGQIYHITDGTGVTSKDFISEISHILGHKPPKFGIGKKIAKVSAKVAENIIKNSDLNSNTVQMFSNNFSYDISKAKTELNYLPDTNWKKQLKESIDWYISTNKSLMENVKIYNRNIILLKISPIIIFVWFLLFKKPKKNN
ncbi:MAG: NAD-dependent epimerase/dehydratase family protein [Cyanobacteriota bacterium]